MTTPSNSPNYAALKRAYPTPIFTRLSLDQNGGGEWRGNCPFCKGTNDTKFLLSINSEGVYLWNCFACLAGGSVLDFIMKSDGCENVTQAAAICAKEMESVVDAPVIAPSEKKVFTATEEQVQGYVDALQSSDAAKGFLADRGITMDVAVMLRFGFLVRFGRGYLSIPRYWKGTLVGLKYRALDGIDDDFKWVQETASRTDFIYLAEHAPIDTTSSLADSVSVYEGELDTAFALSMGFNAVGIFGTSGAPQKGKESESFRESIAMLKQKYAHINLVGDQGPGEEEKGIPAMRRMNTHIGMGACFLMLPRNEDAPIPPRWKGHPPYKDLGEAAAINFIGHELQKAMRAALELNRTCPPVPKNEATVKLVALLDKAYPKASTMEPTKFADTLINRLQGFTTRQELNEVIGEFPAEVMRGRFGEITEIITEGTTLPKNFVYQVVKTWAGIYGSGKIALKELEALTHFYLLLIGTTGTGKGAIFLRLRKCLEFMDELQSDGQVGDDDVEVWDSLDSGAGARDSFKEHSRVFMYVDELKDYMDKAAPGKQPELLTLLLSLSQSTSLSRRKAGKGNQYAIPNCRLSTMFCAQPLLMDKAFGSVQGITLGFYDRLYLDFALPANIEKGLPPLRLEQIARVREVFQGINWNAQLSQTPEGSETILTWWRGLPNDRKPARRLNQVYVDAYLQALSRDATAYTAQDALDAIAMNERQEIIRRRYLPPEAPDLIGHYTGKLQEILENMRQRLARGESLEAVSMNKTEMQMTTRAYQNKELHTFNKAWQAMADHFEALPQPVKKGAGRPGTRWVPKQNN